MPIHLSQVIAVEKDAKEKATQSLAHAQGILGNKGIISGIARTYTPKDDEGEQLPPESTRVQTTVKIVLMEMQESLVALFDNIATKDWTNCTAKADITIDGLALKGVPATYILFLEKQLAEILSFVKKLPTLDASDAWTFNQSQDCWATPATETMRTKKVKKTQTAFAGNDHHPPQILVWDEDVPVGRWKTIKYSGAIQTSELNAIVSRIEKLQQTVKFAREEANRTTAQEQKVGASVLKYVFG